MVSQHSKWKNIFGEIDKTGSFDNITPRTTTSADGNLIDVSPEFIGVNWSTSGGGAVGIFETRNFTRVKGDFPLIYGHSAIVSDLKFSPLNPFMLATSSDDGKVKIWTIPEGGLKEDLRDDTQRFGSHKRKACLVAWNPSVKEVIASMGNDHDLYVWDITTSEELFKIKTEDSMFYNMEWNRDGSLIGAMMKNKKINLFDVRNQDATVLSTEGHDTAKIQKMGFADGPYIYSSGHNSKGYREMRLYDTRNFSTMVQNMKIDTLQGMLSNYFDEDLGLVYLHGKGESLITFVEVKDGLIKQGNTFSSNAQASSVSFFPKRTMDFNQSELARAACLCKENIIYASFKYPRRNQGYQEDFYPPCVIGESGLSLEDWKQGKSAEQIRKPITDIENKFKSEPIIFQKKVIEERKTITIDVLQAENIQLKSKIEELEKEVKDLRAKLENH